MLCIHYIFSTKYWGFDVYPKYPGLPELCNQLFLKFTTYSVLSLMRGNTEGFRLSGVSDGEQMQSINSKYYQTPE